jgi:ribose/xylose/arabinose/galactoside ABC-type transport system permease subunit
MVVFIAINRPVFLTSDNLLNILRQIAVNSVIAFGMTLVILTGGIELCVGATVAVSGVVAAGMMKYWGYAPASAIAIALSASLVVGLVNGSVIATFKVPPFVTTMATQAICRGFAYVFSDGRPIVRLPVEFLQIGRGRIGIIPCPIIIMFVVFTVMCVILYKTKFGRYIFAVGGNEEAARVSGINTKKILVLAYAICGLLAGIGGIVLASRIDSGQPQAGIAYETDAIAATVIGGTSLSGGVGTMFGTIVGAVIIGVINNGLNLMGINQYYQMIVKGIIIAFAVIVDTYSSKKYK